MQKPQATKPAPAAPALSSVTTSGSGLTITLSAESFAGLALLASAEQLTVTQMMESLISHAKSSGNLTGMYRILGTQSNQSK
jgi:predicted DNA-binding ribbon-helix-helix protein